MAEVITESCMDVIADNTFRIEKSCLYVSLGKGIRSVEFIRIKGGNLLFVEAKVSFPNPDSPSEGNLEKFNLEIGEICDKFVHSLNMLSSVATGVSEGGYGRSGFILPDRTSLIFVLVIRNHDIKGCRYIGFPEQHKKSQKTA